MKTRLTDESGFTLVEMLATMTVGIFVTFALFGLVDTATRNQHKAVDRIEATDGGRLAIDIISQELRSRVCISGVQGAIVAGTSNQVEFYASTGLTAETTTASQTLVLQRRRLTYRPAPFNDITEESWVGTDPAPALPPASSTTPTRTKTLLTRVALTPAVPTGTTPFFTYYGMTGTPPKPTQLLTAPLTTAVAPAAAAANDVTKVSRIDVNFTAGGRVANVGTPLQNQILDRSPGCFFG